MYFQFIFLRKKVQDRKTTMILNSKNSFMSENVKKLKKLLLETFYLTFF